MVFHHQKDVSSRMRKTRLFFASKKCRELQEKIHRLAGSMNLPFNRVRRERLNGRKRVP
jgi:hypothetical protein